MSEKFAERFIATTDGWEHWVNDRRVPLYVRHSENALARAEEVDAVLNKVCSGEGRGWAVIGVAGGRVTTNPWRQTRSPRSAWRWVARDGNWLLRPRSPLEPPWTCPRVMVCIAWRACQTAGGRWCSIP